MQLSDNVYVDLEIPNLKLSNFLTSQDVMGLKIVETSGASLPYVVMVFRTYSDEVNNGIKENNILKLYVGRTKEDADVFTIKVKYIGPPNSDGTGTGSIISFSGYLLSEDYLTVQESKAYPGNSLMVVKKVIKDTFQRDVKTSITKIDEPQNTWRRVKQTARYFLLCALEHMNLGNSFPLFTFDKFGNFILKSYDDIVKEGPKYSLVPFPPAKANQYMYMNNFVINNWRSTYNLFAGYNKSTEITHTMTGQIRPDMIDNSPMLAATKEVEKPNTGSMFVMNNIQSGNVHDTYYKSFAHNTNKQMALSSIGGEVQLVGKYYRNIAPLDLVNLVTSSESNKDADAGLYLVSTVSTYIDFDAGLVRTILFLTRDNRNYIEDYVETNKTLKIGRKYIEQLTAAVYDMKRAYSFAMSVMDGEYLNKFLNFAIASKNNMLRCFSLFGQTLDFTSQANLLSSLTLMGNSLMNSLCDMIFPDWIADTFRDFIINEPTLIGLFSNYVGQYVPVGLREIVMNLATSMFSTTSTLNSIAKDNGINVKNGEVMPVEDTTNAIEEEIPENQSKVNEIISDFQNNTTGLDIPFPIIDLDEAENLLPEDQLRDYIADVTIDNLSNLGYLDDGDASELKDILLGIEPINFNLIKRINNKAGNTLSYRYWGTFGYTGEALYAWSYGPYNVYTKAEEITNKTRLYNSDYSPYTHIEFKVSKDEEGKYIITYNNEPAIRNEDIDVTTDPLAELTSYNIKGSYKDKYRTIPCTKTINATGNSRIYFVCPSSEVNLKFYINAKRVELNSFEIDLGIVDIYNRKVPYMVYYTTSGYNSTSVLFEVRS